MDDRKIIRTRFSGVFFGNVTLKGKTAIVLNARRLWYWSGAASLSQLAVYGPSKPDRCKFPVPVSEIQLFNVIELLSVTKEAGAKIDGVKIWKE